MEERSFRTVSRSVSTTCWSSALNSGEFNSSRPRGCHVCQNDIPCFPKSIRTQPIAPICAYCSSVCAKKAPASSGCAGRTRNACESVDVIVIFILRLIQRQLCGTCQMCANGKNPTHADQYGECDYDCFFQNRPSLQCHFVYCLVCFCMQIF